MDLLACASAFALGLLCGSLLFEGCVLMPFWRGLAPEPFFRFHPEFGSRLFTFFAPVTTMAVLLPLASAILSPGSVAKVAAAACAFAVLGCFILYFQRANAALTSRTVAPDMLPGFLRRWAVVHWLRTAFAMAGFGLSLPAMSG